MPATPDPTPAVVAEAPTSSATVTTTTTSGNQANVLDTILVLGALVIIGGVLVGLFVTTVPTANLPIIASLASALVAAVIAGYAGYRWGASDALKKLTATSTTAPSA